MYECINEHYLIYIGFYSKVLLVEKKALALLSTRYLCFGCSMVLCYSGPGKPPGKLKLGSKEVGRSCLRLLKPVAFCSKCRALVAPSFMWALAVLAFYHCTVTLFCIVFTSAFSTSSVSFASLLIPCSLTPGMDAFSVACWHRFVISFGGIELINSFTSSLASLVVSVTSYFARSCRSVSRCCLR